MLTHWLIYNKIMILVIIVLTIKMAFPSPLKMAVSNKAVLLLKDLYCSSEYGWPSNILFNVISGWATSVSECTFCNLSAAKTTKLNI